MSTKMEVPCIQNSLNALWMLGTDSVHGCRLDWGYVWGLSEAQSCWKNIPITNNICYGVCSIQFSHSFTSDSLQPHGLLHARPPCPSATPETCSNSGPSSQWLHPTTSSSVILFSSCLQSFPATGSFLMSLFFTSFDQSIGASGSDSVLPMNIQNWFPLALTGWISLQSKGLSSVLSNTTVQKHQFWEEEPRWRRSRMGRTLSHPQIHQKSI